jgi:hypothetical protein
MKKLLAAAIIMVFISCSGETSSDKYIDAHAPADSADSAQENLKNDSSSAKDTVYPQTDTSSYRKDTSRQEGKVK